jgi:hypothetical protein
MKKYIILSALVSLSICANDQPALAAQLQSQITTSRILESTLVRRIGILRNSLRELESTPEESEKMKLRMEQTQQQVRQMQQQRIPLEQQLQQLRAANTNS